MSKLGNESAVPKQVVCGCESGLMANGDACRRCDGLGFVVEGGLTKRERACIDLRIPESGTNWLDALIAKAQRRGLAAMATQGACVFDVVDENFVSFETTAKDAVSYADALLAELAKAKGETNAST